MEVNKNVWKHDICVMCYKVVRRIFFLLDFRLPETVYEQGER